MNKKKILYFLFICVFSSIILVKKTNAEGKEKTIDMTFFYSDSFSLSNAEGKKLVYKNGKLTGNLKVYQNEFWGISQRMITINMSSKFVYTSEKNIANISFSNNTWYSSVMSKDVGAIILNYNKNSSSMKVLGKNAQFVLHTNSVLGKETFISIKGTGTNVGMKNSKKGIELSNLTGTCDFSSDDLQDKKNSETRLRFLPISKKVRIKNPISKKLKVKGAIPYSKKVSKKVENIHVIPVSATSQALSFNKVKKAKGYVIYRKADNGKMEQAAELSGRNSTVWVDKNIPKGQVRTYVIRSYKIKKGKKVYSKNSYPVSGVTASETVANATKVTLNKTGKIKLKKGKTLKLKAKVLGVKGKKLVSKKIRWCSLNKKKAVVNKKGKVRALKKGTCKIFAKAHNGKNSKAIIIKCW